MVNSGHDEHYDRGLDCDFEMLLETKLLQLVAEAVCPQLALFVGHQHLHNSTGRSCAERRLGPGLTSALCSYRLNTSLCLSISVSACMCVYVCVCPGFGDET